MRRILRSLTGATLLIGGALLASMASAQTVTFTVNNDCNQTIYPAIAPASYDNGGWTMAANTSVSFPVSSTFSGRVWARKNCNTGTSPYACDTGSCGGTGAQCAGSTGQGTTSLAEFTLAGSSSGTDWYDISDVDAYDWPISITMSNGLGYDPTCTADVISQCPAALQVTGAVSGLLASCQNPCNVYATPQVCCTMQVPQDCRDSVNGWPATAQQYVNDIHNDCGQTYSYPWDDWWGLHTVQGGSTTWTITFCPNGVQPASSGTAANYPVAPTGITGTSSGTSATITWNAVSGATSYSIYKSVNDGGNSGISSDAALASGLTALSYTDTGLPSGQKYYYSVIAHNATGFSAPSAQEVIVVGSGAGNTIPLVTANLAATPTAGQIALTWTAATGATAYDIFRGTSSNGELTTPLAVVTSTSYTNTGLTNNSTYYYMVGGVNSIGTGSLSNEINATPSTTVYPAGDIPIDCGGGAANPYLADTDFSGGSPSTTTNSINVNNVTNAAPEAVYQSNRFGPCTYTIPGFSAGAACTVRLHFAETYHTAAGQRTFNVLINNTQVLTSFDIFAAAGGQNIANIQQFSTTANSSGQVVIQFVSVIDNAQINGIEVYPTNGGSAPATPTGLTATAGNAQVALAWSASSGATSYSVFRSTTSGGEGTTAYATGITTASYTNTGLTNGTTYYYTVAALNSYGSSAQSTQVSGTPSTGAPGAPSGLTATLGNAQVALAWTAGSGATSYNVYRGTAAGGESATAIATGVTTTSYTNTGLTNGTAYYFKVASINANGTSAQSNEATATPSSGAPGAPTALAATAGNAQVALVWTAGSGATSYNLYRGTAAGGESATAIVTGITTTSYTNTGLTNGTTYYYKMASVNANGMSAQSNEANATPTGGTGTMILGINAGGTATGSWVADEDYSGGTANTVTNTIDTTAVTNPAPVAVYQTNQFGTCTYTIGGLTANTSYTVRLHFCETYWDAAGARTFNVSINSTQVLAAFDIWKTAGAENKANIQQFTATSNASGQIVITFTTVVDNAQINGIEIDSTSGGTAPSAPTNLTATAGNTQVSLAWNASTGATSYNVYRGTTSGGESATPVATGVTTASYTNTGLNNNITYYFKVAAVNSYGTSAMSNEANATEVTAPPAPTGLTATAGNAQVALSWTASAGANTYNLYRGTAAGGENAVPVYTGISTTSYTNTGLTNGTKYYFTVTAVNSAGTSGASNEASATPSGTLTPVLQINAGGTATGTWVADEDYSGGTANTVTNTVTTTAVTNPAPEVVYQTNRFGTSTYTIGGLTANAAYTVRLHFAETYWTAAGKRTFNVSINGTQVLTSFDIFATAGGENIANIQQFATTSNASGQVVIVFTTVIDNAQINGIEIEH